MTLLEIVFISTCIISHVCKAYETGDSYRLYFNSYHLIWNDNPNEWTIEMNQTSNKTISCHLHLPICIHFPSIQDPTNEIEIHYQNQTILHFDKDSDWNEIEFIHKKNKHINHRRSILSSNEFEINSEVSAIDLSDKSVVLYDDDMPLLGDNALGRGLERVGHLFYIPHACHGQNHPCKVFVYRRENFRKQMGWFFCEGQYDRSRLHTYGVTSRSIASIDVQGHSCCVAVLNNGKYFDGYRSVPFPRGRYRSTNLMGMPARTARSMNVVMDCSMRAWVTHRMMMANGGGGGGMGMMHHGMMGGGMGMGMMNMGCMSYSCMFHMQQRHLQEMMHLMMITALSNQKAIKQKPIMFRRRMLEFSEETSSQMGFEILSKCAILVGSKICVNYDSAKNELSLDYIVAFKKELNLEIMEENSENNEIDEFIKLQSFEYDQNIDIFDEMDLGDDKEDDDGDYDMDYISQISSLNELKSYISYLIRKNNKNMFESQENKLDSVIEEVTSEMDYIRNLNLFFGFREYSMLTNMQLFNGIDPMLSNNNAITNYMETVEWDASDKTVSELCNHSILSFVNQTVCASSSGELYFVANNGSYCLKNVEFYSNMKNVIEFEFEKAKFNLLDQSDWTQIYNINSSNNQCKRLCNYVSMIRVCAEMCGNQTVIYVSHLYDQLLQN